MLTIMDVVLLSALATAIGFGICRMASLAYFKKR